MRTAPKSRPTENTDRRYNQATRKRYHTARWAKLRQQVLARDHGLCQECKRQGKLETGNQIDHIAPWKERPDLFWVMDNLEVLCRRCHALKTKRGE